jgi:ribosome-associated heat shock protein Hsp15
VSEAPAKAGVRADQWLWAARFFKTRSLAKQAIDGGKIEVNSARCKPAKILHVGDQVTVSRGSERMEVEVLVLSDKRGSATVAQGLYSESEESRARREAEREARRLDAAGYQPPPGRPDKRDRRRLIAFEEPS